MIKIILLETKFGGGCFDPEEANEKFIGCGCIKEAICFIIFYFKFRVMDRVRRT